MMYRQPSFVLQKHPLNFQNHQPISYHWSLSTLPFLYLWFSSYNFGTISEFVLERIARRLLSLYLSIYIYIYIYIYISIYIYLYIYLSIYLSIYIYIYSCNHEINVLSINLIIYTITYNNIIIITLYI